MKEFRRGKAKSESIIIRINLSKWSVLSVGQRMASNEEVIEKLKYVKLFGKHSYNQELWEVGIAYTRVAKNFNLTLNLTGKKTCRPFTKLNSSNPFETSATSCTIISFQDLGDRIKGMLMMDLLES